jgi:hypothetical protein
LVLGTSNLVSDMKMTKTWCSSLPQIQHGNVICCFRKIWV